MMPTHQLEGPHNKRLQPTKARRRAPLPTGGPCVPPRLRG